MLLILEESFIRADDFRVLVQPLAHAGAETDETLDAVGGQKRVAEDFLRFLPDAVHAARALDQTDNGPGQIEVHDDGGVLEVLSFAQDIGGDENAEFLGGGNFLARLVAFRTEAAGESGGVFGVVGDI